MIPERRGGSSRAFSLIEVLLVLALVGILAGIVAGNAGAFITGSNFEPPERVLKRAVLDAVYFASERKRASYLTYLEQNATFAVTDLSGNVLVMHRVYEKFDKSIREDENLVPKVTFRAVGPLAGVDGGSTEYDEEHLELTRVAFHAGCSIPFEARIGFRGEVTEMSFDPFSGYVLKDEDE